MGVSYGEGALSSTGMESMRAIINNTANFGPNGVVPVGALRLDNFTYESSYSRAELRAKMEMYLFLATDAIQNSIMAEVVAEWLDYRFDRVLFVCKNTTTSNSNLFNLWGKDAMWTDVSSNNNHFYIGNNSNNAYFTKSGPFGSVTGSAGSFNFAGGWASQGVKSTSTYLDNLIPLLYYTFNSNTYYTLLIDKNSRIVYIGNPNIWSTTNDITDATGTISTDKARLIANIWAWAIEEIIIPGKIN